MKIVVQTEDNLVFASFPNTAKITITEKCVETPDYRIGHLNETNAIIVEGITLPSGYEDRRWLYIDGEFSKPVELFTDEQKEEKRAVLRERVAAKKDEQRDSGTTINGVFIHTDTQARSLLLGEKIAGTGDINFYSRDGVLINMTRAEFDAFYVEFHGYLKAVEENAAALIAQIDAATTMAEIVAVDVEAGWP